MGGIRQATVMRVLRSAAVAALALGTLAALPLVGGLAGQGAARAQDTDLPSQGLAAITAYMGPLVSGDMAAIEAVLAPEFQAMRSEGGGYDRASYLSQGLPHIAEMPEVTDLVATASDGLLVVRYTLRAKVSTLMMPGMAAKMKLKAGSHMRSAFSGSTQKLSRDSRVQIQTILKLISRLQSRSEMIFR